MDEERVVAVRQENLDHLAAAGIHVTAEGVRRAGEVLDAAAKRLSPEAWAALRRGPAVYRDFLADRDSDG